MRERLQEIPGYIWTLLALAGGIAAGGLFPNPLAPLVSATTALIRLLIAVVPLLIFAAPSPAVAALMKRRLAERFAASVVAWYVLSSLAAGLFGLAMSSVLFGVPLISEHASAWREVMNMLAALMGESSASLPLLAIAGAVVLGGIAGWIPPLFRLLDRVGEGIARSGSWIAYMLLPVILLLGITIGVRFGASLGMEHYLTMAFYTAILCAGWWVFYVFLIVGYVARRPVGKVITEYYVPTALFAAGTSSSLATLPVNLANLKKVGVRDEVADFIIPFGAVANMDASALAYVAYAPFILSHLFGIEISWMILLAAWPAIVLFTIAAPGLPAGMGTALWSSTLFAAMLGLEDPTRSTFVATWLALSGGIPDMFRTATNCTGDGFTAIVFDSVFEHFFGGSEGEREAAATADVGTAGRLEPRPAAERVAAKLGRCT